MTFPEMFQAVTSGGPLALAVVFLWLFASGRIRSEKQLTEIVNVYTDVVNKKDVEIEYWRQAHGQQAARGDRQEELNREQMELSKAALAALQGVQSAAQRTLP